MEYNIPVSCLYIYIMNSKPDIKKVLNTQNTIQNNKKNPISFKYSENATLNSCIISK